MTPPFLVRPPRIILHRLRFPLWQALKYPAHRLFASILEDTRHSNKYLPLIHHD